MTSGTERNAALLGAGLLGGAIVARLQTAGWRLCVFDPDPAARARVSDVRWAASEAEAAEGAAVAVLCLPHSGVTAKLAPALFGALASEALVVDCTTGEPDEMAALSDTARQRGLRYLDATIGGSSTQVRAGQALIMVGGAEADLAHGRALLEAISPAIVHMGPAGFGARMKLVMNLALGLNRAVLAEALHLAGKFEIDPAHALSVLRQSPACSRAMDTKGERMVTANYAPEARLSQHRKDVHLMLAAAQRLGIELPLTATHDTLLAAAEAAGFGARDNSAVIEAYRAAKPRKP